MSQPKFSQPESETALRERRTQARMRVQIPARLRVPGWVEPLSVRCRDLSWGGLLLDIAQCLPQTVDRLRVELHWSQDDRVIADVSILRARPLLDGHYLIGARFVSLPLRGQARLEKWLADLLADAAPNDFAGPSAVVRELEVMANDRDDLRQMLEQVGKGRLKVTVFEAYSPGQSIRCVVTGTEHPVVLRLRASVLETRAQEIPGCGWARLFEVTLGFEHPPESVRILARKLMDKADRGDDDALDAMAPPAQERRSRSRLPPESGVTPRAPQSLLAPSPVRDARSALETAFPEALNHLTPGWGDAQAFETLFRDLVLGDTFQLGGWPEEVWAELTLLQDVHDLAYGVSAMRTALLKGQESK